MWSDALTVAQAASYAAASVIPITEFSEVIRIRQLQDFEQDEGVIIRYDYVLVVENFSFHSRYIVLVPIH